MKIFNIKAASAIICLVLLTQCSLPVSLPFTQGSPTPVPKTATKVPLKTATPTITPTATHLALTATPENEGVVTYSAEELQNATQTIVKGNQKFSFDLFHPLTASKDNFLFSPFAVQEGLMLISAGSGGVTQDEIKKALNIQLPEGLQNDANKLVLEKVIRQPDKEKKDSFESNLDIFNTIWIQSGYVFLSYFNSLAINYYGSGVNIINLKDSQELNRQILNQFIYNTSSKKIDSVVQSGLLDNSFQLLFTSASYFESPWADYFDIKLTADLPFTRLDGSTENVPTMQRFYQYAYARLDDLEAIELPYKGNKQSMLIILPAQGKYQAVENSLDQNRYREISDALKNRDVNLFLPKFQFSSSQNLTDPMKKLGINTMFTTDADVANMVGRGLFRFGLVAEKSVFAVDEFGTQISKPDWPWVSLWKYADPNETVMKVNRPFIVIVRDNETGAILYLGRVLAP